MNRVLFGIIGSVIGGALGAGLWALVIVFAERELSLIAIGVGALAGIGMALGAQTERNFATGIIAAVIALLGIGAGKYIAVDHLSGKALARIAATMPTVTADVAKAHIAEGVTKEFVSAQKKLTWPEGKNLESAANLTDYPKEVVKDVEARWALMDSAAQTSYMNQMHESRTAFITDKKSEVRSEVFKSAFRPIDLLWAAVAIFAAFKFGAE